VTKNIRRQIAAPGSEEEATGIRCPNPIAAELGRVISIGSVPPSTRRYRALSRGESSDAKMRSTDSAD